MRARREDRLGALSTITHGPKGPPPGDDRDLTA